MWIPGSYDPALNLAFFGPAQTYDTTAGGVLFAGSLDRMFAAYDAASGKQLWKTRLNDAPSSSPISYVLNGRQYVAMVVGNGGAHAATWPPLVPEIRNPPDRGAAVRVFAVGN